MIVHEHFPPIMRKEKAVFSLSDKYLFFFCRTLGSLCYQFSDSFDRTVAPPHCPLARTNSNDDCWEKLIAVSVSENSAYKHILE